MIAVGCARKGPSSPSIVPAEPPSAPSIVPAEPPPAPSIVPAEPPRAPKRCESLATVGLVQRALECMDQDALMSPDGSTLVTLYNRVTTKGACHETSTYVVGFWRFVPPNGVRTGPRRVEGYEILECVEPAKDGSVRLLEDQRATVERSPDSTDDGSRDKFQLAVRDAQGGVTATTSCTAMLASVRVCASRVHRRVLFECISGFGGDCSPSRPTVYRMLEY